MMKVVKMRREVDASDRLFHPVLQRKPGRRKSAFAIELRQSQESAERREDAGYIASCNPDKTSFLRRMFCDLEAVGMKS